LSADPNLASDPTFQINNQYIKMETTLDIMIKSDPEPLYQVLLEATFPKLTYSAIASGKNTTSYNKALR
ncbi:10757_t:CDS:2, partial [Gigaspora margarita]